MYHANLIDIPVEQFGGYIPAIPPTELPPGASPFCQDVEFPMGAVRTRGGLFNFFPGSPIPVNASINGLKSYITPALIQRLMAWDSLGNLYKENPQGTLNLLFARPQAAGTLYQSTTLFGREYQAFFNNSGGVDIPRQYDDTNWDRVSQDGPGISPSVTDENVAQTVAASPGGALAFSAVIAASPNGLTQNGFIVTLKTNLITGFLANLRVGDPIQVTGAGVGGYNGTFTVSAIFQDGLTIQYVNTVSGLAASGGGTLNMPLVEYTWAAPSTVPYVDGQLLNVTGMGVPAYNTNGQTVRTSSIPGTVGYGSYKVGDADVVAFMGAAAFGLAASGNGTVTNAGSIVAGLRQISVVFITEQSFITKAAKPNSWTAVGGKRAVVASIPTGPANVLARLLLFTPAIVAPATTGPFFSLPNGVSGIASSAMLINDNVTTTVTVDFNDAALQAGFQAGYLFTERTLGECAFTGGYNYRSLWLGERIAIQNATNLQFDGGFQGNVPFGWTLDAANGAGGSPTANGDWQTGYVITGDGATAIRGKITQPFVKDYLGVAIISPNTSYSLRVRVSKNAALAQGTLHINLTSVVGGFTTIGLALAANQVTQNFAEYIAVLVPNNQILGITPSDLTLQLYADGTPTNTGQFIIDSIEIFATTSPFNYSTVWLSHAFNPESFDNTTSQIQIRPSDGQQLRAGFPIRNSYYLGKDHYLVYITDDGVNEPSSWPVTEVSATIGIAGPNAVDYTEEWAVFAERSGAYICWGSDPVKIVQEIQEDASLSGKITWNSINWQFGFTIVVRIDQKAKKILIAAPVNGATSPNVVFMMDYKWLQTAQDIADSPMVTYSAFTGKILSHGRGRRWTYWNMTVNSLTLAERIDGTSQPFFGNGSANGKIYQQIPAPTQLSDDGVAINGQYAMYYAPSHMEEQAFQMKAVRKLLGYIQWLIRGAGSLLIQVTSGNRVTNLRNFTLSQFPTADAERPINIHGHRFSFQVGTNAVGAWFQMEKFVHYMKRDPVTPARGVGS